MYKRTCNDRFGQGILVNRVWWIPVSSWPTVRLWRVAEIDDFAKGLAICRPPFTRNVVGFQIR